MDAEAQAGAAAEEVWSFPASPEIAARMRRILERFCSERGIDSDLLTGIKLAVTEAASNAVLHGYLDRPPGKVTLRALVEGPDLLIQVIDEGRGMSPRVDSPGLGLGLSLIASFADDVEIAAGPGGKGTVVGMRFAAAGRGSGSRT